MAMNQSAMVEELAFLIKDNLSSKHLILSTEEAVVNFLQDDTSPDGVLELEPVSPYHRMLLHRLADIYGFAHESVGEGDERHLVLERCPESSIPSILISDILWQYDDQSSTTSHQLLRRRDASPALKMDTPFPPSTSLEEREAAYMAARDRIFSLDVGEFKEPIIPKPRNVPLVARRMIAHALGQRICSNSAKEKLPFPNGKDHEQTGNLTIEEKNEVHLDSNLKASQETILFSSQNLTLRGRKAYAKKSSGKTASGNSSQSEKKMHSKPSSDGSPSTGALPSGSDGRVVGKESLEQEHFGAAKRMFAHALGLPSPKENHGLLLKCNGGAKHRSRPTVGVEKLRT
eukprot:TRINITY_DN20169_c0_g1_i1.p1 TRINITY_DN20169_c0_g1~~TRINITY_DN20169_c0_g1_i1.p1  ORF type:complete len:345 (-),score=84.66 TRINITY_DN20169_c0_g1_i1:599-1633(-)